MGSRIMHLIIGNKIAERLSIEDRTSFLLGSIAPDAVQTKDESHFFKGEHQNYTRYIDYHGFLNKYKSYSDNLYVLGYFTHLIADDQVVERLLYAVVEESYGGRRWGTSTVSQ